MINDLYENYVISIIKNYFALRKNYERILNKLIDNKIKSEFPFFIVNKINFFHLKNKIKSDNSTFEHILRG